MAPAQVLPNVRGSLQEVLFAQRLADNEKKNRDRALKKLKKFLSVKSSSGPGFTDDDAIKVWKGLFYCMYMADKPLVQEDVAEEISYLIHHLGNLEDRHTFTKAAFRTFAREWNGIDVFRIDKFMMFVRRVLRQVFVHLKLQEWDLKEVAIYANILDTCVVRADDHINNIPLGLKLHLCSIIMEELAKIGGEKLKHEVIVAVIQPFLKVLALSKIKLYKEAVSEEIIRHLMRQSEMGIEYEEILHERGKDISKVVEKDDEGEETKDDEGEETKDDDAQDDVEMTDDRSEEDFVLDPRAGMVHAVIPQIFPDFNLLAEALQNLGGIRKISKVNRKLIYTLVKELRDLAREVYPLAIPDLEDVIDMEDSEDEEEEAVKRLQKFCEDLKKPGKTNIDEIEDLKSDPLSKYSIHKQWLSRKAQKKRLKPVEKKILTLKQKQEFAKQQRAAEMNRKKAVEEKVRQIAKTVDIPSVTVDIPSTTKMAKKKKASRKDTKEKEKQSQEKKTGGFEVSAITSVAKKDKNELSSEVNNFEVNTITGKTKIGKKRKNQTESEKCLKKRRNSFEVTELSSPLSPKAVVQPEKAVKKKKRRERKSADVNEVNKVGVVSPVEEESKRNDPENCKDGVKSKGIDEQLPKEKKEMTKEPVMENGTLGGPGVSTIKDNESEMAKINSSFDVPDFLSSPTETPSQQKSPTTKGSNKKAKKAKKKAKLQESPKETLEIKSSEMEVGILGVMGKSKGKLNKTEVTPSKTVVIPSKTLFTPSKTAVTPSKTLVTPSKTLVTPSKTPVAPSKTLVTPSKTAVTPTETAVTSSKTAHTPSKTAHTPSKTASTPSKTAGTPSKTTGTPSKTTGTPSKTAVAPSKKLVTPSRTGAAPIKAASFKDKGLVLNFSENKAGDVWSQPLQDGEIEMFIKSRRQIKLDKKRNAALGTPKRTPKTPKTPKERSIKINLKQNQEHDFKDYVHSVRNSPQIPFSADKLPKAPVLKPSSSPILVRRPALKILKNVLRKSSPNVKTASPASKRKSPKGKRLKRSRAADFF